MAFDAVENMDRDRLLEYVRSLLWQFRLVDAFWFIFAENKYGLAAAEDLNTEVWGKVGKLGAKDILDRFGPFPPGVEGFVEAYGLFPWSMMVDYQYERTGDGEIFISVANCPAQEGRLKHGLGEYSCKDMHHAEFQNFATVIDPNVKVECVFAPPDPHPGDCFCKWRVFVGK